MTENTPELWLSQFPFPKTEGNKYSRGSALVVGGGLASTGAARLAAMSALRVGAGLVNVASPSDALSVYAVTLMAVMVRRVDTLEELATVLTEKKINVALIGPAAGVNESTRAKALRLLASVPTVLDADALTVFAQTPTELFFAIKNPTVLTPHEGEFARLFPLPDPPPQVGEGKKECALSAAKQSGAVVLLKGAETIIASPDGRVVVNNNAPPTLATAGSGDVLAGIITGLIAQKMPAFEAACAGAWLHGDAASRFGAGLIAEDLPALLPKSLQSLGKTVS